jgi:hypothetical protein
MFFPSEDGSPLTADDQTGFGRILVGVLFDFFELLEHVLPFSGI